VTPEKKRARSLEEKSFRRQQILDAASALFAEVGYEGFSVALLASKAGIVKGTLYLYFKTREEVFLALYDQSLNRWSEKFIQRLPETLKKLLSTMYRLIAFCCRKETFFNRSIELPQLQLTCCA